MIWNKFSIIAALIPSKDAAGAPARRWRAAAARDRELVADLVRMGGILTLQPMNAGEVAPIDPTRLAYEAGRRDLALQLLSMMQLTISELNQILEDNDVA